VAGKKKGGGPLTSVPPYKGKRRPSDTNKGEGQSPLKGKILTIDSFFPSSQGGGDRQVPFGKREKEPIRKKSKGGEKVIGGGGGGRTRVGNSRKNSRLQKRGNKRLVVKKELSTGQREDKGGKNFIRKGGKPRSVSERNRRSES